jgi:hypothetical protein
MKLSRRIDHSSINPPATAKEWAQSRPDARPFRPVLLAGVGERQNTRGICGTLHFTANDTFITASRLVSSF